MLVFVFGDNPGSYMSPPLSIGWNCSSSSSISVNEYEKIRDGKRRDHKALLIPSSERRKKLLDVGFTMRDIVEGIRAANHIRSQRQHTKSVMKYSKSH